MSVRILEGTDGYKVIYCSTTMQAFGPIFYEDDDVDDFLEWLPQDARLYDQKELDNKVYEWREHVKEMAFERYSEGLYEGDGNFADNH